MSHIQSSISRHMEKENVTSTQQQNQALETDLEMICMS